MYEKKFSGYVTFNPHCCCGTWKDDRNIYHIIHEVHSVSVNLSLKKLLGLYNDIVIVHEAMHCRFQCAGAILK